MAGKLKHHSLTGRITIELLAKAFKRVKRNKGAAGVDRVSIAQYENNLGMNLAELMRVMKQRHRYQPQPNRRVWIPKTFLRRKNAPLRPLGIPGVRDRVAQEVVRQLLEPIFEPKFHPHSTGFRPNRGCHTAVQLVLEAKKQGLRIVVDADIKGFFDNLPQDVIMKAVCEEVADGNILEIIRKFLSAGVMEDGKFIDTTRGTPQGGVVTPPTQSITLNSSVPSLTQTEANRALANRNFLFFDINGIIFMSYEQILCGGKKPPDQLRQVAFRKAPFKCSGDCRVAGAFWDLAKTSLSLRPRSRTGKSYAADPRTKGGFYRQSSPKPGAALTRICSCDGAVHQRYCNPSFGADSPSWIKAWLRKALIEKSKWNTAMIVSQL